MVADRSAEVNSEVDTDSNAIKSVPDEESQQAPNSNPLESDSVISAVQFVEAAIENNETDTSVPTQFNNATTDLAVNSTPVDKQTVPNEKNQKNFLRRFIDRRKKGLTRRQILICVIFACVEFFAATVISIQAPFFPKVAHSKGATPTEYGFVFGIFELTVFIMSPIFGAKMYYFGPKKVFNWGIFTTGFCCVIFGLLNFIEGRTAFIVSCFIVRTIEAVGDAAFVVASFTIIALEFPDTVAQTFGTMETFYGFGMIAGPTLGGALYAAGGYTLPFALMGSLLFIGAIVTYILLPEIGESPSLEKGSGPPVTISGFAMFKMLRFPVISMIAFSIVSTANGVGFLHATLERHLDSVKPGLNEFFVGAIFILNGGVYAITAPLWGKICEKSAQPKYFTVIGSIFTILGFIFVGPLPFLPIESHLWNICIGLVLFGLGLGSTLVSAFIQALKDAIALGYPDDLSTYGLVSGLWTSMTALGFFIGSSMGGILLDSVKFRWGTTFVLLGQFVLVIMLCLYFFYPKSVLKSKPSDKTEVEVNTQPTKCNESEDMVITNPSTVFCISNSSFEKDE